MERLYVGKQLGIYRVTIRGLQMKRKGQTLPQAAIIAWASAAVISLPLLAAPVSFDQAVADYKAGKYGQALSEMQAYAAAYPNNALVRYYIALCQQSIGHFDQAKTEFDWVAKNGDVRLRSMAEAGLQQLSRAHTQTTSAPTIAAATPPRSAAPALAQVHGGNAKVSKVLEFYTDW